MERYLQAAETRSNLSCKKTTMRISTLPLILVVSAFGTTEAQFVEVADQRSTDVVYGKILPLGDSWAIAAWGNPEWRAGGPMHYLTQLNDAGEEVGFHQVPMSLTGEWEWGLGGDMVNSLDGGIFLVGLDDHCDYWDSTRLIHLNTDGTALLDRSIAGPDGEGYVHMADLPSDQLALLGSIVMITDLLGEQVSTWPFPLPIDPSSPVSGLWTPSGNLLLAAGDRLMLMDPDGTKIDSAQVSEEVRDLMPYGDTFLVLTDSAIHRLQPDLSLNLITTYSALTGPRNFLPGTAGSFFQAASQLFRWAPGSGITMLVEPALLPGQSIRSMALKYGRLVTSSTVALHGTSTGLMRTYGMDNATSEHTMDIGLEEITVDSSWFRQASWNANYHYLYANLSVTLRNNGLEQIDSLVLAQRTDIPAAMCGEPSTRTPLSNLQLMPNGTVTLPLDSVVISIRYYPPGAMDVTSSICLVAQSPNQCIDRSPEDNFSCIALTATVGLDELQRDSMEVWPNPFTDRLYLNNGSNGPLTISLYDAHGRKVFSDRVVQGNGVKEVLLPELPDGIYLIQGNDGEHHWTEHLIRCDH